MSSYSTILRNGLIAGLGVYPAETTGMKELFTKSSYIPKAGTDLSSIVFDEVPSELFVRALTYDFERFALSSRETYLVALSEKISHGSLGWPLLKYYYASFFAAHAIMRSRGCGFIKLERENTSHINEVTRIYDPSLPNLSPGIYVFTSQTNRSASGNTVSISLTPDKGGSGVHESFWSTFCEFINEEATKSVRRGDIDSGDFMALADSLTTAIKKGRSNGGIWLSSLRNEINYQHKYDSWMPNRKGAEINQLFSGLVAPPTHLRLDHSKVREPISAFLNTTCFISGLAFETCDIISQRSTRGSTFGPKWLRLNNLLAR